MRGGKLADAAAELRMAGWSREAIMAALLDSEDATMDGGAYSAKDAIEAGIEMADFDYVEEDGDEG